MKYFGLPAAVFALAAALLPGYLSCQKPEGPAANDEAPGQEEEVPYVEPDHAPVRPSGEGWVSENVDDGIVYWHFQGTDPVSGVSQSVHVADVDLNKEWGLEFTYDPRGVKTSDRFKEYGATVAMNGGFGASQIFIKESGIVRREIDHDESDGIPNWRNDAAICVSSTDSVFICNNICNSTNPGKSLYGAAVKEQRDFFKNDMADVPDIISGSPLLIYGYDAYGLTFVPMFVTMAQAEIRYAYEHPYRHQGVRHPRTAVGITADNHLIMLVADGRYNSYCCGFTCKELTNFLISNFDPKYAMNLDGGGSSTLCVAGFGDEDTHVVNYPCDNGELDYDGERTVQTHICVIKRGLCTHTR
ncbi:MAG: phosphodiester glycosidase family protein [Bacteroidales bacterium]|nr:phosphodiester glycosidase family protein [Candidatus Cryptobacteroides aphodequi]